MSNQVCRTSIYQNMFLAFAVSFINPKSSRLGRLPVSIHDHLDVQFVWCAQAVHINRANISSMDSLMSIVFVDLAYITTTHVFINSLSASLTTVDFLSNCLSNFGYMIKYFPRLPCRLLSLSTKSGDNVTSESG